MAALKDYLKSLHKEMCLRKILTPSKMSFFLARNTRDWDLCGFRQDAAVQAAGQEKRGHGFLLLQCLRWSQLHQAAAPVPKL